VGQHCRQPLAGEASTSSSAKTRPEGNTVSPSRPLTGHVEHSSGFESRPPHTQEISRKSSEKFQAYRRSGPSGSFRLRLTVPPRCAPGLIRVISSTATPCPTGPARWRACEEDYPWLPCSGIKAITIAACPTTRSGRAPSASGWSSPSTSRLRRRAIGLHSGGTAASDCLRHPAHRACGDGPGEPRPLRRRRFRPRLGVRVSRLRLGFRGRHPRIRPADRTGPHARLRERAAVGTAPSSNPWSRSFSALTMCAPALASQREESGARSLRLRNGALDISMSRGEIAFAAAIGVTAS
jgi:hypothetical protein